LGLALGAAFAFGAAFDLRGTALGSTEDLSTLVGGGAAFGFAGAFLRGDFAGEAVFVGDFVGDFAGDFAGDFSGDFFGDARTAIVSDVSEDDQQ